MFFQDRDLFSAGHERTIILKRRKWRPLDAAWALMEIMGVGMVE